MTGLTLLPAVDVTDGHAVQLVQGVAGSGGQYGDPMAAALAWQRAGASWIHLVDLDAAFGRGSNADLLADVVQKLDVQVEMSGGIRDEESLSRALATGCARVNIGTAALENPDWVRSVIARHGERVAVGLDVRGTRLAARGWTAEGGELFETLGRLDAEGCARYVVTDVLKDGTLPRSQPAAAPQRMRGARPRRWWPAGECPAWPTCGRSHRSSRWGWRGRSSAPPSTRARSRWRRRWLRSATQHDGRGAGDPLPGR